MRADLDYETATLTMKKTLARELGDGETDGFASGTGHVCQELMCQREIDSDPARNNAAVCPRELEKRLADTLGVTDISAIADRRLAISECLDEGFGDRFRHQGKPEHGLQ